MTQFNLVLEEEDIQALGQMIDVAVKAGGASLVNNAFVLLGKLRTAEPIEEKESPKSKAKPKEGKLG